MGYLVLKGKENLEGERKGREKIMGDRLTGKEKKRKTKKNGARERHVAGH